MSTKNKQQSKDSDRNVPLNEIRNEMVAENTEYQLRYNGYAYILTDSSNRQTFHQKEQLEELRDLLNSVENLQ